VAAAICAAVMSLHLPLPPQGSAAAYLELVQVANEHLVPFQPAKHLHLKVLPAAFAQAPLVPHGCVAQASSVAHVLPIHGAAHAHLYAAPGMPGAACVQVPPLLQGLTVQGLIVWPHRGPVNGGVHTQVNPCAFTETATEVQVPSPPHGRDVVAHPFGGGGGGGGFACAHCGPVHGPTQAQQASVPPGVHVLQRPPFWHRLAAHGLTCCPHCGPL